MSPAVSQARTTDPIATPWIFAAILFWLANVVLHLEFSNWIIAPYPTPWGEFVPRDHTAAAALIVGLGSLAWIVRNARHGVRRRVTALAWLLWALLATVCMSLIATTQIEMIHYLQYGILAWLLAKGLDPRFRRWPLITILGLLFWFGMVDELNQYFYLTPNNNSYIDFNDFLLNLVGGIAGVLAYYGFRRAPDSGGPAWQGPEKLIGLLWGLSLAAVAGLVLSGRLLYTPGAEVAPGGIARVEGSWRVFAQREPGLLSSWQPSFSGDSYYVSGVVECAVATASLLLAVALYRRAVGDRGAGTPSPASHPEETV